MAKNPFITQKSQHIDIKYHSIQQLVVKNLVHLEACCNLNQTADILTKALVRPKYKQHTGKMGLTPI